MAKRYHSSKSVGSHPDKFNDETHHSRDDMKMGPYPYDRQSERAEYRGRGMRGELYAGAEPRRRQEMEDAGMIREDHSAVANLPQNVVMSYYPKEGGYLPENIDDTIRGVDRQIAFDNGKKMAHFYPKKV